MRLPLFVVMALGSSVGSALDSAAACGQAMMTNPAPAEQCGVGLFAQQRSTGVTVWTTLFEDHDQAPQDKSGLHVVVTPQKALREVTLRVTFLPYGLRAVPTDSITKRDMQEQTRTFHLSAKDATEKKLTGDLLLGRVSGVKSVAVEALEFADGSSWKAPTNNPCSVAPSGYLPVRLE
ncbi:hypothetical protein SAMN05421819_2071 [Bryocella elongata]|uniref:Uncharacterized protein n=1 Tax=Bryocella elongata TaxID=863522 RepID=A0A1H5Y1J7_9BACT|nr:hypothetical protein [Bryocella elongata]SEG17732.1 hypothetical protein SAMN05421819_2071 [Bryocella elongata]